MQALMKGVDVDIQISRNVPSCIIIDEKKVTQVLVNFLTNALKFTSTGSITLLARVHQNELLFGVRDTGIGMDNSMAQQILEQMNDLGNYQNLAGLGLHISNAIVKALGSERIYFETKLGSGSYFYFYCPIPDRGIQVTDRDFNAAEINEENTHSINLRNLREFSSESNDRFTAIDVLVVDDSEFTQMVTTQILNRENFSCNQAFNGREAVDIISRCASEKIHYK